MKAVRVGVAVMLLKDGKVLLGKRNDDPLKADSELHGEGTWTLPGGKMDFHEEIKEAARRELYEETGVQAKKLELMSIGNEIVPDKHFVTIGFLCRDFEGTPETKEPEEIERWEWFLPQNLPSPMFPPSEKAIKNYLDNEILKH